MDRTEEAIRRAFEDYSTAARRSRRTLRRRHTLGQVTSDAADALERAEARLALATAKVFMLLTLHGTDRLVACWRLEMALHDRIAPAAVRKEMDRTN